MTAFMALLHMLLYYGVAFSLWGFALKKSFLWFGLAGVALALLISAFFVVPIIAAQKSKNRIQEMMFASGSLWLNLAIIIAIAGGIAWIGRVLFFNS